MYLESLNTTIPKHPWQFRSSLLEWYYNSPDNPEGLLMDYFFMWVIPLQNTDYNYYSGNNIIGLGQRSNRDIAGKLPHQQFYTTIKPIEGLFDQSNTTNPLTSYGFDDYSHTGSLFRKEQEIIVEANIQCLNTETFINQQSIIQTVCIPRKDVSTLFIKIKDYFDDQIIYTKAYLTSKEVDYNTTTKSINISLRFLLPEPLYYSNFQLYHQVPIVEKQGRIDMEFPVYLPFLLQKDKEEDRHELSLTFNSSIEYPFNITMVGYISHPIIYNVTTGKYCKYNDLIRTGEWIDIDTYTNKVYGIEFDENNPWKPVIYKDELPLMKLGFGSEFIQSQPHNVFARNNQIQYINTFTVNANFGSNTNPTNGKAYIRHPYGLWF